MVEIYSTPKPWSGYLKEWVVTIEPGRNLYTKDDEIVKVIKADKTSITVEYHQTTLTIPPEEINKTLFLDPFDPNASYYDVYGYNEAGYSMDGYDRSARDQDGFMYGNYDEDGYNMNGYDKYGFNRSGYSKWGFDRNGFNREGYNGFGYDAEGFNKQGFNKYGYNKEGKNNDGESWIDQAKSLELGEVKKINGMNCTREGIRIKCSQCEKIFFLSFDVVTFYIKEGIQLPKNCGSCRDKVPDENDKYEGLYEAMQNAHSRKLTPRQLHYKTFGGFVDEI